MSMLIVLIGATLILVVSIQMLVLIVLHGFQQTLTLMLIAPIGVMLIGLVFTRMLVLTVQPGIQLIQM